MVWNRAVYLLLSFSTCSSHAYWTMHYYSTSDGWMQGPGLLSNSSWRCLFTDHCNLMARSEYKLQTIVSRFAKASHLFGLTVGLSKTEVVGQPVPGSTATAPSIQIDGTQLKSVNHFKYLGSIISPDGTLNKEIETWITKASKSLVCLHFCVMSQGNIKLTTKIMEYKAVVLNSLLYGYEMWTLYRKHIKQLECFHIISLEITHGFQMLGQSDKHRSLGQVWTK